MSLRIVNYRPEHQPYFEKFNREWIEKLFEMEPVDEWVLTNPGPSILDTGGAILMAEFNGVPVGTVGLRKLDEVTWEFTKMAVDNNYRRMGIAKALSLASFEKAAELGAKEIILYSNTKNTGAVELYEQLGFTHLPVEQGIYKRANVKMMISIEDALNRVKENQVYAVTG